MYSTWDNINKSLKLAWKHKLLWLFAAMVVGGSFSSGNSSSSNTRSKLKDTPAPYPSQEEVRITPTNDLSDDFNYVLGASARKLEEPKTKLELLAENTTYTVYIWIAILLILLSLPVFFVIFLYVKTWASGALIAGSLKTSLEDTLDLKELSDTSLKNLTQNIWFGLMIFLRVGGLFLLILIPVLVLFLVNAFIGVFALIIGMTFFVIYAYKYMFITAFGVRRLLERTLPAREALIQGTALVKTSYKNCFKLLVGDSLVAFGLIVGSFMVLGALIASFALFNGSETHVLLMLLLIIIAVPLFFCFIIAGQVFTAYLRVFTEFSWSILYQYESSKEVSNANTQ
jgi:hypothetical protein